MSEPADTGTSAEPSPQDALNALTPEVRAQWELTGDWPEPKAVTATADADPEADEQDKAEVAEAAPAVEAKAEPVVEKTVSKRQQHINELERKAKANEIRANELEAKIAALEAKTAPPKEEPKPAAIVDPKDPEPQEADFEDYRSFVKALSRWEIRQDKREADAAATVKAEQDRKTAAETEFSTKISTWVGRRDAFLAKHPEAVDRLAAFLDPVRPNTPLGDALMDSEVGPELADYLSKHPTEVERIARLAPISALRALGKLEAQFSSTTHASASVQPAAKTVTTAPAPPTTLAARSADPSDPVAAAVARGDYSAFEAEENRKALAAAR